MGGALKWRPMRKCPGVSNGVLSVGSESGDVNGLPFRMDSASAKTVVSSSKDKEYVPTLLQSSPFISRTLASHSPPK